MKTPQRYLDALTRLLAPRPQVKVFNELVGLQCAIVEEPRTFQIFIGMSHDLYKEVANALFVRTGKAMEEFCDVAWASGTFYPVAVAPAPYQAAMAPAPDSTSQSPAPPPLLLLPRPFP